MMRDLYLTGLCLLLTLFPLESVRGQIKDPTRLTAPVSDLLRQQLASFREIELAGLVTASGTDGVALIRSRDGTVYPVRTGSEISLFSSDISFRVKVTAVTDRGIRLRSVSTGEELRLPVAYDRDDTPLPAGGNVLRYVEFNRVPLRGVLRMMADQSRRNYVCSEAAAKREISLFLRNLSASGIIEELCKSHALWYTGQEGEKGSIRILTLEEFQENLASFQQDEMSETFTLLYPNVTEVASIIQGLYADRVVLSMGDENILDDEMNDLSRRFERFNTMSRAANSELMGEFNVQNSYSAGTGGGGGGRNGLYTLRSEGGFDRIDDPRKNRLVKLNTADAKRIQKNLASGAGTNRTADVIASYRQRLPLIYVTISRRNNLLIVRSCDPHVMQDIRALVAKVDKPTPMVLLDIKLIELTLTDDLNTIFDYRAKGNFDIGGSGADWNGAFPAAEMMEKAMSFQIINRHFTARVQALREKGNAKVIATPTLLTPNNEVNQLFIGKEIPITREVNSQTVVTDNNVVTTPETQTEFKRVGTQLLVTPSINADRTVMLRLLQQNSEVSADQSSIPVLNGVTGEIQQVPVDVIESRSVTGTFVAKDKMAVAAGGLIREEEVDEKSGIPILMDIPYLGWFFRKTVKTKRRTELLILITPHVISTPGESAAATSNFLKENSRNPSVNRYIQGDGKIPEIKDQKQWRAKIEP